MLRSSAVWLSMSLLCAPAFAQSADPLSGFATNTKDPIQIEADRLTILDQDKKAEFSGKVNVVQGEMTMKAEKLVVFYSSSALGGAKGAAPQPDASGGSRQISRIEAEGGVMVRQKDQVATGDKAVYEAADQIVRMTGGVTLAQGDNVVRGDMLVVNLATRKSEIISGSQKPGASGGRVTFIGKPGEKKPVEKAADDKAEPKKR